jgi:uncharacterized coiled-coil protein SlyX
MEKTIQLLQEKLIQQHTEYNFIVMENHKRMKKMKKRMDKMEETLQQLTAK